MGKSTISMAMLIYNYVSLPEGTSHEIPYPIISHYILLYPINYIPLNHQMVQAMKSP